MKATIEYDLNEPRESLKYHIHSHGTELASVIQGLMSFYDDMKGDETFSPKTFMETIQHFIHNEGLCDVMSCFEDLCHLSNGDSE